MSTTVDPLRLAALSVESAFLDASVSIRQVSPNRICVLLLGLVAGTDSRYLCEDGDREEVVAEYLCEAIFAMLLWLTMDFMDLGVLQDDLTPRNIIIRPPARPGPFPPDERCLVWLETDADDVRAVMVNFERIHVEYPSNPEVVSWFWRLFSYAVIEDQGTVSFQASGFSRTSSANTISAPGSIKRNTESSPCASAIDYASQHGRHHRCPSHHP
ncbi:uncharacterized protein ARMOST_12062 [Armillaria ostoyae]|uniref:Uncharacterized protein n=1 Tax=Armillaria ostoyae TaxID=47428 RepID=A0A284RIY3_ARMOS|nr:uncharacterized protein ARMOST_12062 [Armillaria ostoyae]